MKIFLTGASGLAGSNFALAANRRGHEVIGVVGQGPDRVPGASRILRLDLRSEEVVTRNVLDLFPDAIVNAAAISENHLCEQDPESARLLNAVLPGLLGRLANHLSARYLHLSTEQVFDGRAAPYLPGAKPSPLSLYGRLKAEGETAARGTAAAFTTVIRLPLLTGNSLTSRRSFHERLFAQWAEGKTVTAFTDEIRQPCSAENAAAALVELCERSDFLGTVHWAGAEPLSRHAMAAAVARHFKLPEDWVRPGTRADHAGAPRPPDLSLVTSPLAGRLKTEPESFAQQLEKMIVPRPFQEWYHQLPA